MNKLKITPQWLIENQPHGGKTLLELIREHGKLEAPRLQQPKVKPTTIVLNIEHVRLFTPSCPDTKRQEVLPALNETLQNYGINANFERTCFFLANVLHECAEFRYAEELASGSAYDTRTDLGNTPERDGDGQKYKGRGDLQCTGYTAYRDFGDYVRRTPRLADLYFEMYGEIIENMVTNPFLENPRLLATFPWRTISAGWVWTVWKKLNDEADRGDFLTTVRRINGGYNGLADRLKYLEWVMNVLHHFEHLRRLPESSYRIKL